MVGGAAFSEQPDSTSPDPPASLEGQSSIHGKKKITFDEFPVGTKIHRQYEDLGIVFTGSAPTIRKDTANPTSPVLGTPGFNGTIKVAFTRNVTDFWMDAGFFNQLQSVRLTWFDRKGRRIGSRRNRSLGIEQLWGSATEANQIARFTIRPVGEEDAGYAIDNLTFRGPVYTIYAGICGGSKEGLCGRGAKGLDDDPTAGVRTWRDKEIAHRVNRVVPACRAFGCRTLSPTDFKAIRKHTDGGIMALGFFMTDSPGDSIVTQPGNSDVAKSYIVSKYKPGDKVFGAGHSQGGGDLQNLLEKLAILSIPVQCSGHIDSLEPIGDDATIPANTREARNFFQKQSHFVFQGEDELVAADPSKTKITNDLITDPKGPAKEGNSHHHKNMDNDGKPTTTIKRCFEKYINKKTTLSLKDLCESGAGCGEPVTTSLREQVEGLRRRLDTSADPDEVFWSRSRLARSVSTPARYRELLELYEDSAGDDRLQQNLSAVFLKIDVTDLVATAERAALETDDYSLYGSITYSLGRTATPAAKVAALRAALNPHFRSGPVQDAILNGLAESQLSIEDAERFDAWMSTTTLSDLQVRTLAAALIEYADREVRKRIAPHLVSSTSDAALQQKIALRLQP